MERLKALCVCVCVRSFGVCCGSRAVALLLQPPAGRKEKEEEQKEKEKKKQKFNEPCLVYTYIHSIEEYVSVEKVQIYR